MDQHIGGFNVPVNDTGRMRDAQCVQNAQAYLDYLAWRQRPCLVDEVSQGTAREQFHDDPRTAVIFDDIVDGDNAGMVKPSRRTGLLHATGACQLLIVLRHGGGEHDLLNGNVAVQDLVVSAPDNPHPTLTDGRSQAVPSSDQPIGPPWHDKRLRHTRSRTGAQSYLRANARELVQ